MKKIVPVVLAVVSAVLSSRCAQTDEPVIVRGADDMTNPRFARRTWVIYQEDLGDGLHLAPGDAFRLRHRNRRDFFLIPLRSLRNRWNMEGDADDNRIPLVVGSDGSRLCGMVEMPNHADADERAHLLVISPRDSNNEIYVDLELYDDSRDLVDQCDDIEDTHRGRAHGEN